jgi:hypothetical protein
VDNTAVLAKNQDLTLINNNTVNSNSSSANIQQQQQQQNVAFQQYSISYSRSTSFISSTTSPSSSISPHHNISPKIELASSPDKQELTKKSSTPPSTVKTEDDLNIIVESKDALNHKKSSISPLNTDEKRASNVNNDIKIKSSDKVMLKKENFESLRGVKITNLPSRSSSTFFNKFFI